MKEAGFGNEDALSWLDEPEAHDRFCFLMDWLASTGRAVTAMSEDEPLPIKQDGKWSVPLWPTGEVARLSLGDRFPDAKIVGVAADELLSTHLPIMEEHDEVLSAYPNRQMFCHTYPPDYVRECLTYALRSNELVAKAEAGTLTSAEEAELRRMTAIVNSRGDDT